MSSSKYLDAVECSDQPLDFAFHPKRDNIIAAALVDGSLEVHDIHRGENDDDDDEEPDSILSSLSLHTQILPGKGSDKGKQASCRAVEFSFDGNRIYTGGSVGDLCCVDAERVCSFTTNSKECLSWRIDEATEGAPNPLLVVCPFHTSRSLLATGDDLGGVRVWDERIRSGPVSSAARKQSSPHGCVLSWKENEDYISDMELSEDGNTLLASSADGRLSVFDLRMARDPSAINKGQKPFRVSDNQEDELLSLQILKNGKKVVCGTQEGVLSVFSWGTWGDCSDRFPGHPSSIEALLKVDEDTVLTGSSDGFIRVVQIQPDKLLGVIGQDHGGFPVEKLGFNASREIVGSVSHDNQLHLWDARILQEGSDNDSDNDNDDGIEDNDHQEEKQPAKPKAVVVNGNNSDDDWDDMDQKADGDDNSDDRDDSDSDEEEAATVNEKRKKRLKTEAEKFFDDL